MRNLRIGLLGVLQPFSCPSPFLLLQMQGPPVKTEAEFSEAEGAPWEEWQKEQAQEGAQGALSRGKGASCPGGIGARSEVVG